MMMVINEVAEPAGGGVDPVCPMLHHSTILSIDQVEYAEIICNTMGEVCFEINNDQ